MIAPVPTAAPVRPAPPSGPPPGPPPGRARLAPARRPPAPPEPRANPARRVRIAHVQLLPLMSGVQRVALDELERLDPAVFDRTLILKEPGEFSDAARRLGVRCLFVPELVREVAPRQDLKALAALTKLLRAGRFDVVHTHSSKPGVLGRVAAGRAGVPAVVHTVQGFAFPAAGPAGKLLFAAAEWFAGRRCDAVICMHEADAALCAGRLRMPPGKVRVLPNGIDVGRCRVLSERERAAVRRDELAGLNLPPDAKLVATVGRLWPQKNPLAAVAIARRLRDLGEAATGGPVHWLLVGDGELEAEVAAAVAAAGLGDRVHLLGWRSDGARLAAASDLFCLPSRWEGLPLGILEALAAAVPVVASDIPGNRAAVEPGVDGFLEPVDDIDRLAGRVAELLADDGKRAAFGDAAAAKIRERFEVGRRVRAVVELYRELGTPLGDRDGLLDPHEPLAPEPPRPR